jgi:hypothetical protein
MQSGGHVDACLTPGEGIGPRGGGCSRVEEQWREFTKERLRG